MRSRLGQLGLALLPFAAPGVGAASASDPNAPTVFAALSDWGGKGVSPFTTPAQLAVASALANISAANDVQFVLSAGNNFLPSGLPLGAATSAQAQQRWFSTWTGVYKEPAVPWYMVAGYADWLGNCTAERAFTDIDPSQRWQFPDLWHTLNVAVPPDWGTMQIVMIDTVTLAGEMSDNTGAHDIPQGVDVQAQSSAAQAAAAAASAPVVTATAAGSMPQQSSDGMMAQAPSAGYGGRRRLRDFNRNYNPPISTVQWQWLESFLNASTAQWLIVVGNDPIWSAGAHGPTWALVDTLLPMLDAAGVALYISGRDPVAQHFLPSAKYPSVDFASIGTGAGGNATQAASLPSSALNPAGTLQWSYGASGAFLTVSMGVDPRDSTRSLMTVSFYDQDGTLMHSFTKFNPRTKGAADPPAGKVARAAGGSPASVAVGQGAIVLVFLVSVICAGGGYFWHLSNQPPEKARAGGGAGAGGGAIKRVMAPPSAAGDAARGKGGTQDSGQASNERTPLVVRGVAGPRRGTMAGVPDNL